MPLRLIDPGATKEIIVSDTSITIRQLSGGEKGLLYARIGANKGLTEIDIGRISEVIAAAITRIDGIDPPYAETIKRLGEPEDFWKIVTAVLEFSTLSEDEQKNLPSS